MPQLDCQVYIRPITNDKMRELGLGFRRSLCMPAHISDEEFVERYRQELIDAVNKLKLHDLLHYARTGGVPQNEDL